MKSWTPVWLGILLLAGCATTTVESRKKEKQAVYDALPADLKQLVDHGQIKAGMSAEAVYIAWGQPSEILHGGDRQGESTTWLYTSTYMQETRFWTYREVPHGGDVFLEQYLAYNYDPRDYVKAELVFVGGKLASWRTLPKPLN